MSKKHIQKIKKTAENLLGKIGVDFTIIVTEKDSVFFIEVESKDSALLIGRGGENLFSLEHILKLMHQKDFQDEEIFPKLVLDVCGYRKGQVQRLEQMAARIQDKVLRCRRPEILEPMNAYERRVIHMALKNNQVITTESIGDEPYRRIIVKIK